MTHIERVEKVAKLTADFFEKGYPDIPRETIERFAALSADLMSVELGGETLAAKEPTPLVRPGY